MSHPIPAGTPKAVLAARFGAELRRAIAVRGTTIDALERATGISDSALDTYLRGHNLPRTEKAAILAEMLHLPLLLRMVVEARTGTCERPGCPLTFRNDTGRPRKYCSAACQRQAEAMRTASTRARQAGQTGDGKRRYQEVAQLRSAVRIGDERLAILSDAVARFCVGCEPEGVCHDRGCSLRAASPLPIEEGHAVGFAETEVEARKRAHAPEARAKRSVAMRKVWERPEHRERIAASSRAMHAGRSAERNAEIAAKAKASYPAERRSETSRRVHAARRAS